MRDSLGFCFYLNASPFRWAEFKNLEDSCYGFVNAFLPEGGHLVRKICLFLVLLLSISSPVLAKTWKYDYSNGAPNKVEVAKGVTFVLRWRETERGWRGSIQMTNTGKYAVYPLRFKMKLLNRSGQVLGAKTWRHMELRNGVSSNTETRIKREKPGEAALVVLSIQGGKTAQSHTACDLQVLRIEVTHRLKGKDWKCRAVFKNIGDAPSKPCKVVVTKGGRTLYRGSLKKISPKGSTSIRFQSPPGKVTVRIDPQQKNKDLNWQNNRMTKTLK